MSRFLKVEGFENIVRDTSSNAIISNNKTEFIPIIGSVYDQLILEDTFKNHKIDIIIHAAAYKHVPLLEKNILEAVKVNILGQDYFIKTKANPKYFKEVSKYVNNRMKYLPKHPLPKGDDLYSSFLTRFGPGSELEKSDRANF